MVSLSVILKYNVVTFRLMYYLNLNTATYPATIAMHSSHYL